MSTSGRFENEQERYPARLLIDKRWSEALLSESNGRAMMVKQDQVGGWEARTLFSRKSLVGRAGLYSDAVVRCTGTMSLCCLGRQPQATFTIKRRLLGPRTGAFWNGQEACDLTLKGGVEKGANLRMEGRWEIWCYGRAPELNFMGDASAPPTSRMIW